MKKSGLFLISIFLISVPLSFQQVVAQEKSKEDMDKDIKIQQAIEVQKKAMLEQKKAHEQALQDLQKSQDDLDNSLNDINVQVDVNDDDKGDESGRHMKRINRSFHFDEPFLYAPEANQFYINSFGGDEESTSWEFSRSVKEKTLKSEYSFDVEKTASSVVMSVNGDCKEGEIRVKIMTPEGKTYSDIVIDESGNLNWRKSFSISETENQDKTGAWKFQISSNKATGHFRISLHAN